MLSLVIFIPLLAALAILVIPSAQAHVFKGVAVAASVVTFLLATWIGVAYLSTPKDLEGQKAQKTLPTVMAAQVEAELVALPEGDRAAINAAVERGKAGASTDELRRWAQADKVDREGHDRTGAYERARAAWVVTNDPHGQGAKDVAGHIKFVDRVSWIPLFNIDYFVGVDGLSLPLVWLTALLGPLCLVYSWNVEKGAKAYFSLFLLLECGLIGVFCALDFFLFYVFWEIVLLPMYFLIGVWGGPRRIYAAIKFFIYTLVGSVLMLIAMLALYFQSGIHTFNMLSLHALADASVFGLGFQWWIFLGLFIGFAIKVPVFPFHTWLPDAHVEAPTAISVVLAGVLLKMGGDGVFRLSYPLCPDVFAEHFTTLIAWLGLINLVYGAFVAMAQTDFKKLVAYSSVSHMGYVLLGLAAFSHAGVQGAALQMLNHGVSSAMMFFLVGVVYDRAHHRDLNRFGGLALKMPVYASIAMVGFFASLGLPGLNGFISEAMVFLGMWDGDSYMRTVTLAGDAQPTHYTWMIFAALLGIVMTAAYILWTIQRVFMGPLREEHAGFTDLNWREGFALAPLAVLCVALGVYPMLALWYIDPTLTTLVNAIR